MQLGMVGLGRMGSIIAQRLLRGGHLPTGYDPDIAARKALVQHGGDSANTLAALVEALPVPRTFWLMLPAGAITDATLMNLLPLLAPGDTVIDGGNSNYKDTLRHATLFAARGMHLVDCGTSGGIRGLDDGFCLMIGGAVETVDALRPLFEALAPAIDRGWGRVGPVGAGHFAKMVHNGIEYGLMQAFAEGFSLLQHKQTFGYDVHQVAEIWRHGSVIRSWLLDLVSVALAGNPQMQGIAPYVEDSGEGRWTVNEAIDLGVAAPVITLSLLARLRSRNADSYSDRLLATLRNEFGGHPVRKK